MGYTIINHAPTPPKRVQYKNYLDHVYAVSDDSGDILEHYRYTAFGEVSIYDENGAQVATTQIDNHILWNTRRRDELTGYYMYKFRHYSAELGRWLARDPIRERGGVNLYGFVGNDAINYWDYLGLRIEVNNDLVVWRSVNTLREIRHSILKQPYDERPVYFNFRTIEEDTEGATNCFACIADVRYVSKVDMLETSVFQLRTFYAFWDDAQRYWDGRQTMLSHLNAGRGHRGHAQASANNASQLTTAVNVNTMIGAFVPPPFDAIFDGSGAVLNELANQQTSLALEGLSEAIAANGAAIQSMINNPVPSDEDNRSMLYNVYRKYTVEVPTGQRQTNQKVDLVPCERSAHARSLGWSGTNNQTNSPTSHLWTPHYYWE